MKKPAIIVAVILAALLLMSILSFNNGMSVHIDDMEVGGPLGFVIASAVAGGGLLLAFGIVMFVGAVLAVVFAGLGLALLAALSGGALLAALAIAPLLLPLAIPVLLIWYLVKRSRNNAPAQPVAA